MTVVDELRAGEIGPDFLAELARTVRAVGISRNVPPPDGRSDWDVQAVELLVNEFLSDHRTPQRLVDLALHCDTVRGVRARLQETVRNFMADLGRATPVGKLVVRVNDVLRGESGFVRVDGRWALAGGPTAPVTADLDDLVQAISAVSVEVPNWSHQAKRSAPVADRQSVAALCRTLLARAGGSLPARVLAVAMARRLGVGETPLSLDATAFDMPAPPGQAHRDTEQEALRSHSANEVLAALNDRQRLSIAFPEYSVRELSTVLGVSPSQAHVVRRQAIQIMSTELAGDEDAEAIASLVIDLSRIWADKWTADDHPPY